MSIQRHGIGLNKGLIRVNRVDTNTTVKLIKFRLAIKRAPYLSTFNLHNTQTPKYLTYSQQMKVDYTSPDEELFLSNTMGQEALDPNIETNFGRSGRVDAPRPKRDQLAWTRKMEEYDEWLEPQKEAEFVRNLPAAMLEFDTSKYSFNSTGLLVPDKSTETELVYVKASGDFVIKYTGVRHESFLNRLQLVPLMGGSSKWMRWIKLANVAFYTSLTTSLVLPLSSIWAMMNLSLGKAATWSSIMPMEPVTLFSVWAIANIVNGIFFYIQNYNRLVKAVWFEPSSYSVCVELHNWFHMFNIEKNFFLRNDDAKVIKIPFKFLSPDLYGPEEKLGAVQFDFSHPDTGGTTSGALGYNATNYMDYSVDKDLTIHGKCFMLPSMPLNIDQIENLEKLEPFSQLIDSFKNRVKPANTDMIPDFDLSSESIDDFYEMDGFTYGTERFEREQLRQNFQFL